MHDKAKELFSAFKAGQMSRRELMSGVAKLGVSAATATLPIHEAAAAFIRANHASIFYRDNAREPDAARAP